MGSTSRAVLVSNLPVRLPDNADWDSLLAAVQQRVDNTFIDPVFTLDEHTKASIVAAGEKARSKGVKEVVITFAKFRDGGQVKFVSAKCGKPDDHEKKVRLDCVVLFR